MVLHKTIILPAFERGFHLITELILSELPELKQIEQGTATLLLQHTSASLCLNENADPTVMADLEAVFNRLVPEDEPYYRHINEGSDDLPAHIKSGLLGVNLVLPIVNGLFQLGTWQGIVLGEHRNHAGPRSIAAVLMGDG